MNRLDPAIANAKRMCGLSSKYNPPTSMARYICELKECMQTLLRELDDAPVVANEGSYQRGYDDGYSEGNQGGYERGKDDGYSDGYSDGYRDGKNGKFSGL